MMYSLRSATIADYEFLYDLHVASLREYIEATWGWNEGYQRAHFQNRFNPQKRQIVQVGTEDVGVVSVENQGDSIFLALIEILPAYQVQRIGTTVITDIIQAAHKEGKPVTLFVLKVNKPARRLYKRLGFTIINEEEKRFKMACLP